MERNISEKKEVGPNIEREGRLYYYEEDVYQNILDEGVWKENNGRIWTDQSDKKLKTVVWGKSATE